MKPGMRGVGGRRRPHVVPYLQLSEALRDVGVSGA